MGSSVVLMQLLVQPGCKLDPCNDLGYKLKGKDFFKWGFVVIFFFFYSHHFTDLASSVVWQIAQLRGQ